MKTNAPLFMRPNMRLNMKRNARLNTEKSMRLSMSRNARPSMRQSTRKNVQQHTRINVKLSMKPYARKLPLHHMEPQLHLPMVLHHQFHPMDSQLAKENMAHPKLLQKDTELQPLQNVHNKKSKSAQRFQDNNANKS